MVMGFICAWRCLELDQTSDLAPRLGWTGCWELGAGAWWHSAAGHSRRVTHGGRSDKELGRQQWGEDPACHLHPILICLLTLSLVPQLGGQPRSCAGCGVAVQERYWFDVHTAQFPKGSGATCTPSMERCVPAGQTCCWQIFTCAGGSCAWSTRARLPSERHSAAFPMQAPASSAAASCKGGIWSFPWFETLVLPLPDTSSGICDQHSRIITLS